MKPFSIRQPGLANLLALALLGCPPANGPRDTNIDDRPPPATPPAKVDEDNVKACAALARVGCPEAHPVVGTCEGTFAQAEGDKANIRYQCFADATSKEIVRGCGGPGYFTVRCK